MPGLNVYQFTVNIECETEEQATEVLYERIGYDDNYGFDYRIWREGDVWPS